MTTIAELLNWSESKQVTTSRGERLLRTATPTSAFWGEWRNNQNALRDQGISVSKDKKTQEWLVCWWQPLESASIESVSDVQNASNEQNHVQSAQNQDQRTNWSYIAPSVTASKDRKWSDEQKAIFEWFGHGIGNLVVRARAGTGKTTTVKEAFQHAPEDKMLYVVFNKKNQKEAEAKITDQRVEIKTLHSLGYMFIQAVWSGVKPDDKVEHDRIASIVRDIPDEVGGAIVRLVSFAKNTTINPTVEQLMDIADSRGIECPGFEEIENGGYNQRRIAEIALQVMEKSKQRDSEGRISFNDMVWLPVAMTWVRAWYDLVCVDEAQDMNLPQLIMARGACKKGGRICVVGDDRQSIYGFRGAHSDGLSMMKESLKAKELGLTTTYRCPKTVVSLASSIVTDYRADVSAPEGIVENLSELSLVESLKVGDALLSRANAPLMGICLSLLRKGTPARIEGRDLGKQLVGIVRKLKARSVPNFIEKIEAWGAKQRQRLGKSKHAEERLSAITDQVDTLVAVAEGASSVFEIEKRLQDLFQDSDQATKPSVILSSIHKSKGLEFPRVFVLMRTFVRKGGKGKKSIGDSLETENLKYVAFTRSQGELYLVQESAPQNKPLLKDGQSVTTAA